MEKSQCAEDQCIKPAWARGLCHAHYIALQRAGGVHNRRCEEQGCDKPVIARRRCTTCYEAWRNSNPDAPRCAVDACDLTALNKGMCRKHYKRASRYGLDAAGLARIDGITHCEVCQKDLAGKGHVDHCHDTGRVRGVLCRACNSADGMLESDIDRVLRLVEYLRRSVREATPA